jgi:hypothetical protein
VPLLKNKVAVIKMRHVDPNGMCELLIL